MRKIIYILLFFFACSYAHAGWLIVQKNKDINGVVSYDTIAFQYNRMVIKEKQRTLIFHKLRNELVLINHKTKQVWKGKYPDYKEGMARYIKERTEEVAATMPEEKRNAYRAKMNIFLESYIKNDKSLATFQKYELVKKQKSDTILSYHTERYDFVLNGKTQMSVWIAPQMNIDNHFDKKTYRTLMNELNYVKSLFSLRSSDDFLNLFEKGYILKIIEYIPQGTISSSVVSVKQKIVPEKFFYPPIGYTVVSIDEIIKQW